MDPALKDISKQTEVPVSEVEQAFKTSTPSTPPNAPKKSHKTLILLMILFVFFVIAAFFAGTYYQGMNTGKEVVLVTPSPTASLPMPTSDSTADWKTYLNTKVGFEVKYPARYPRPALPSGLGPTIYADGEEDSTYILFGDKSTDSIGLQVFPFTRSIDDLVKYKETPSWDGNTALTAMKTGIVAGQEALWYRATPRNVYPAGDNVGAIKIYFLGKDHGFIVDANANHNEQEIDQILKTFRFLDQAATDSARN